MGAPTPSTVPYLATTLRWVDKKDWLALVPLGAAALSAFLAQLIAWGTKTSRQRRRLLGMFDVLSRRPALDSDHIAETWSALERQTGVFLERYVEREESQDRRTLDRVRRWSSAAVVIIGIGGLVLAAANQSWVVLVIYVALDGLAVWPLALWVRRLKRDAEDVSRRLAPAVASVQGGLAS
jgi:hypothetical protein